jgi:hypothetical protein
MNGPITKFFRSLALRKNASTVPTRMTPLREIKSATVFVDSAAEDAESTCNAVRQFFGNMNIPVSIFCPDKSQLNWLGYLKDDVRGSRQQPRKEDLFISLVDLPEYFADEFEARCSTAAFKVGRRQLGGNVYDMVVSSSRNAPSSQSEAFSYIKDYLNKLI